MSATLVPEAAAGSPELDEERIESLVRAERVRALYDRTAVAQTTVVLNSAIVALVLWGHSSTGRLLSWLAAIWLVAAARLYVGLAYRRSGPRPEEAPRWARFFTLGAAANGIAWGLAPLLFREGASLAHLLFLAFVLGGMAAGGALSNASHPPAFLAFTVPALLPIAGILASAGGRLETGMAIMVAIFGIAVSAISRSGGRTLVEAERLRFRNAELARRLAAFAAQLEQRVGDRTGQLEVSMAREREAVRGLANSARLASLGTLAAGVAHEVNNPLTYVSSSLTFVRQELAREPLDSQTLAGVLEAVDDAVTGVGRVRSIVRRLNDASRTELRAGAEPVDLHAALDFCLAVVAREIEARASLVREYGDVPRVRGDQTHLVQLFLNLLLNATEAIPEGKPAEHSIRVSTRQDLPSGDVVVEVADTGCGIADASLERIWEPFFEAKQTGTRHGFGLSICRNIVLGLGGRISVRSRVGSGSTFTVWLKAMAAEAPMA